jgi:hypothetical protein
VNPDERNCLSQSLSPTQCPGPAAESRYQVVEPHSIPSSNRCAISDIGELIRELLDAEVASKNEGLRPMRAPIALRGNTGHSLSHHSMG